jgi:uncharacterized pyridoxal phosphate-dependent enzyme
MSIYEELDLTTLVNAAGTITTLGGSLMDREVLEAMVGAAGSFVDMEALHLAAGKHIAALIGAPAAHICDGAAAGIALMAAACMAGADRARVWQLPDTTGMKSVFLTLETQDNHFDQALRQAGGRLRSIPPTEEALTAALQADDLAGVFYTHAWNIMGPNLPLDLVAQAAHGAGLPLILDAAAEVPPLENFRRFVGEGADLVTFSGGKAIGGPQASGFIVGRPDLVEACRQHDCPIGGIGRPMKVGKEEIAGLVKAVERYVARDHAADLAQWDRWVALFIAAVSDLPGVRARRAFPFGVGQQIPHAAISWDVETVGIDYREAVQQLRQGEPSIVLQLADPAGYTWANFTEPELRVHPHTLIEGQAEVVARRLREVLGG